MRRAVLETKSLTEVLNPLDASHPTGDNGTSLIHRKPISTFYSAHSNIIHLYNNGRLRQSLQKKTFLQRLADLDAHKSTRDFSFVELFLALKSRQIITKNIAEGTTDPRVEFIHQSSCF